MKHIDFSHENSILNNFVKELRSVEIQGDPMRFRCNVERIGEVMAYEVSKTFQYEIQPVKTPLGTAHVSCPTTPLVLGTILRAAMPFHAGLLSVFDRAENAFISAYRKMSPDGKLDIHADYMAAPQLDGKTIILCDPMLATGGSMEAAYQSMLSNGTPKEWHLLSIIASQRAVDYLKSVMPDNVTLWTAAIDPILNEQGYIVPGLGDAGDLCFGDKL